LVSKNIAHGRSCRGQIRKAKEQDSSLLTSVFKSSCDFSLVYLTLWFCPYFFKTKAEFTHVPLRGVNSVGSAKKY
jgi:hypothetical protein